MAEKKGGVRTMKKVAAVLTALLLLGQPAAAECLITGEAYRIGASAAVVS